MQSFTGMRGFIGRVRFLSICFAIATLLCVGRLYYLQVMKGAAYAAQADRQFVEPANPLFDRGAIYFSGKDGTEIAAATNQNGVALAVEPPKVADMSSLYAALNAITPLPENDFMSAVLRPGAQYVVVADRLSTTTGARITAKRFPGVVVADDRWRYYPGGSLAAQDIGFVAYNSDALEGRYGLERYYEDALSRSGENLYTNFFVELFAGAKQVLQGTEQGDVVTTIEPTVQTELERELNAYQEQWKPQFAGGIIMDPQTGAIYAMAQTPTFDLNQFSKQTDPSLYNNRMVEDSYEMGSIVKPITMAAGLDAGVITPETTYNDTGCITVDTAKICNWDLKARGVIPMQQILSQSLNVGASFVATQLGPDRMRSYFEDHYGFGTRTGIDLPGEVPGQIGNFQSPRQLEYDTSSFGQGFAATPIQTVRALATVANGGYLVTPHLAKAIRTETGIEKLLSWPKTQVLKPESAEAVQQMLTKVVDDEIAHGADKLDHWSVGAKTGTAQIANPAGGGYYTDRYLHSYVAFFPSYNARFIIFLFSFEPQGAQYSSETWTTTFHNLTLFLINYYNVPPDR